MYVGSEDAFEKKITLRTGQHMLLAPISHHLPVWKSSNPKVVVVDQYGVIRGQSDGKANITGKVQGRKIKIKVEVASGSVNNTVDQITDKTTWTFNALDALYGFTGKALTIDRFGNIVEETDINTAPIVRHFNITFNSNGGSTVSSQLVPYGGRAVVPSEPTLAQFTFAGWYYKDQPFDFNTRILQDYELVAHWEPIPIDRYYLVRFDPDNGDQVKVVNVKEGTTVSPPNAPTYKDHYFRGWYENGELFNFNTVIHEDHYITARWISTGDITGTYVVTFDTDGGSYIPPQIVNSNSAATRPHNPTKDGYDFYDWELDGYHYDFSKAVTSNITLKAVWTPAKTDTRELFTVTFDSNGGTEVPSQQVYDGDYAVKPTNPTREGYNFRGWYIGSTQFDFATPITSNISLFAKWTEDTTISDNTTFTVIFDSAGGTEVPSQTVKRGDTAIKPTNPTRDGYTFDGWYYKDELFDFSTPIMYAIKLTAHWTEVKTVSYCKLTLLPGNGENSYTQQVEYGTVPDMPKTPTFAGYTLKGWYDYSTNELFSFSSPIYKDYTLIAKWMKNDGTETITVYFDNAFGTIKTQTIDINTTVSEPSAPTHGSDTFLYWSKDGVEFDFSTPLAVDTILIARWEGYYLVTFNRNNGSVNTYASVRDGETVTRPELQSSMKFGLSDTVIKELQDVFRRHANHWW